MATLGLCVYCNEPAARTCKMCGKAICKKHADPRDLEVCVSCASGTVME